MRSIRKAVMASALAMYVSTLLTSKLVSIPTVKRRRTGNDLGNMAKAEAKRRRKNLKRLSK